MLPKLGAAATISLVIPVSAWIGAGIEPPGLTSVDHSEVNWKPSTSMTPISVTRSQPGSAPVVSRSTMARGPSSACMDVCTVHGIRGQSPNSLHRDVPGLTLDPVEPAADRRVVGHDEAAVGGALGVGI